MKVKKNNIKEMLETTVRNENYTKIWNIYKTTNNV